MTNYIYFNYLFKISISIYHLKQKTRILHKFLINHPRQKINLFFLLYNRIYCQFEIFPDIKNQLLLNFYSFIFL
jgi:hypothetical protein